jgi:hypothetical protein
MDGCPMITFSKDWPRISGQFSRRNGLIRVSSGSNGQSTTDRRDVLREKGAIEEMLKKIAFWE